MALIHHRARQGAEACMCALPSGDACRWGGGLLFALALHGGVLFWLLPSSPRAESVAAPPPAIMITFAETAQAINTASNDISAAQMTAQESQAARPVKAPETDEVVEKPPEKPLKEEKTAVPMEKALIPLPTVEKKSRQHPAHTVRHTETHQLPAPSPRQAQASSKAAIQAQAQVTPSQHDAARQATSSMQASPQAIQTWQSQLMARLERYKKYPAEARARRETGTVFVRFSLDTAGNVLSVELARSSGFSALDSEVLALVRRASPLPAPPADFPSAITAPVAFSVK